MFSKLVTNSLLFLYLLHLPLTGAENVFRAVEGATVLLPCPVHFAEKIDKFSIDWSKNSTNICTRTIDKKNKTSKGNCINRFTVDTDSLALTIENVQPSDSGNYNCKILRLIPPPTFDQSSSLILQVAGLSLQQLNSTGNVSCVHLRCSLEDKDPEPVNFSWSRDDHMIPHTHTSNEVKSELSLCKPDWTDGDTITCHVNYSSTQSQKSLQLGNNSSNKDSGLNLAIHFLIHSIFWITYSLIFFCIFKCQILTRCCGPSTSEERRGHRTQ